MMKKVLFILAALIIIAAPTMAFHDEGVAHCNGCHTMHNSQDGALVDPDSPLGNQYLLTDADPSDVCLACHSHIEETLGTDPLAPPPLKGAGNFVYLLEDNLNDGHNGGLAANWIPGDAAGHNLVAPGHGLAADATLTSSPGGTFPASVMSCTSCHDPHGNANFRMLYGASSVQDGLFTFTNPAPAAEGLSLFFGSESQTSHTAYQGGMSTWCSNCHGDFHNEAGGRLEHPSGSPIGGTVANTYNLYNGTIDQLGGVAATAYLAEVPFEAATNTTASTDGPNFAGQVSCITCHRAHATSAPDAGRWDFNVTFLHEDGVESLSYAIPDPYANLNQRSLCNKCHNKDAGDANPF
jgi:hypothetical protein